MNVYFRITSIAACLLILTGCPNSSHIPFEQKGKFPLRDELVGYWKTENPNAVVREVTVDKAMGGETYTIYVVIRGEMYSSDFNTFNGWISEFENHTFLVIEELESDFPTGNYYLYHIEFEGEKVYASGLVFPDSGIEDDTEEEFKASVHNSLANNLGFKERIEYFK